MATTVTFLNQKGGVGKTSTCHHLSGALARLGHRVLLVDNDPQASLTQGLLGPSEALRLDPDATLAAAYAGRDPLPGMLIRPTAVPGIDLVPGGPGVGDYNLPRPHDLPWATQEALRDFLGAVAPGAYHLVLIDCPPNLNLCSWAALGAADALIVPLQPEDYGAQGIAAVRAAVVRASRALNPRLRTLGYLLTMVQARVSVHRTYEAVLREAYGDAVFAARVPHAAAFKEALTGRLPVSHHAPRSAAAQAMRDLASEVLARLAREEAVVS